MPFEIDTAEDFLPAGPDFKFGGNVLMDSVLDALPADAPQSKIDDLLTQRIIGDLRKPKLMKTVRAHFIMHWPLIVQLAEREPDLFDSIILELAEQATFKP